MITLPQYQGKTLGVFGLGKAGSATVESLRAGGAEVYAWDDGWQRPDDGGNVNFPPSALCHPPSEWPWPELVALVLSPGVPFTHPAPHAVVLQAKEAGVRVIGDIELLQEACPDASYIGITGTNGKSTTTALIGHILKQAGREVEVGGNLGTPALQLKQLGKNGVYVIETSSYQLDLLDKAKFHAAVFLNLTPDHLDRHGSMEGYLKAKCHIFRNQQTGDVAVVAVDDAYTRQTAETLERAGLQRVVRVSAARTLEKGISVQHALLADSEQPQVRLSLADIPTLQGRHNWQNAACAYAAARSCGIAPEVIASAMQSFPGLAHRMELIAEIEGVRFINDSKATNAEATANALAAYESIYWISGGKAKEGGIASLAPFFPKIRHAFLIGAAEEAFAQTLKGKVPYTRCGTLDKALEEAARAAFAAKERGAVVLLSPACASFDQFKSFEHRGDVFRELVRTLARRDHAA